MALRSERAPPPESMIECSRKVHRCSTRTLKRSSAVHRRSTRTLECSSPVHRCSTRTVECPSGVHRCPTRTLECSSRVHRSSNRTLKRSSGIHRCSREQVLVGSSPVANRHSVACRRHLAPGSGGETHSSGMRAVRPRAVSMGGSEHHRVARSNAQRVARRRPAGGPLGWDARDASPNGPTRVFETGPLRADVVNTNPVARSNSPSAPASHRISRISADRPRSGRAIETTRLSGGSRARQQPG